MKVEEADQDETDDMNQEVIMEMNDFWYLSPSSARSLLALQ